MSDDSVARPSLGQAASLGSLYNAHTDQILAQSVFEDALAEDHFVATSDENTQWTFTQTDTLKEKFSALDLSGDLSASFLAGLITVSGSGGWLSRAKSSARVTEASAIYTVLTKKETLDFTQNDLEDLVDADALQTEGVTHVVHAIQWGARVIVTALSKVSDAGNPAAAQRVLRSFEGGVEDLEAVTELAKSFEFKISSDVPGSNRSKSYNYDEVSQFLQKVTGSVEKSNDGKGFRLSYDLTPIAEAAKALGQDDDFESAGVETIDESLLLKVVDGFDELYRAKQDMSDYVADVKAHSACVPKEHALAADKQAKKLKALETLIKSKLSQALVSVRVPDSEDTEIVDFLAECRTKLDRKREPLSVIGNYVPKMAFADIIQAKVNPKIHYVADDIESTNKLITDAASGDVFVFYFDVAGIADPTWAANRDKAIELIGDGEHATVIFVDCDMGTSHRKLEKPRIEQLRGGTVAIPDLVVEIESLAGKSLLRTAKPEALLQPTEQDPQQDKQRPVKILCPGPNCASNGVYEWICPTCKDTVLAGYTDDYLYCGCGKYLYTDAVFKCRSEGHGEDFATYSDKTALRAALSNLAPFEEFNILILGETGVGKSTFINAFINYLVYDSLADAQKAEGLRYAIPSSFSYDEVDKDGYVTRHVTITVGNETDLEKKPTGGVSATQKTVTYALNMNGKIIRLIDTPGIGDTRGLSQDQANVKDILETLESINQLSTVLFLMKPNSSRLTTTFDFCITELLTHLHKDTSKNIVFGFTNARSTNYQLGDTREPLEALLAKRKTGIDKLDHNNLFFFDSESFRFLAAFKQEGVEMPGKEIYNESWEKSAQEARRLVNTTLRAPTHEVKMTLALNRTRTMIVNMTKPMVVQTNAITQTKFLIKTKADEFAKCVAEGKDWEGKTEMEQVVPVRYNFKQPKTVCTHKDCVGMERNPSDNKTIAVYKTVCHDDCIVEVPDEQVGLPELSMCAAFACKGQPCDNEACGHDWRIHLHITHEYKMETEKIKNSDAVEALLKSNNKMAAVEQQLRDATARNRILEDEDLQIKKALATFGVYLDRSAIVAFNDATIGYLEQLIKKAEVENNTVDIDRYKNDIASYKIQRDEIQRAIAARSSEAPSEATIGEIITQLGNLPTVGKSLRKNLGIKLEGDGSVATPRHRARNVRLKPSGTTVYSWMIRKLAKGYSRK